MLAGSPHPPPVQWTELERIHVSNSSTEGLLAALLCPSRQTPTYGMQEFNG
jgi:hypothetical protein